MCGSRDDAAIAEDRVRAAAGSIGDLCGFAERPLRARFRAPRAYFLCRCRLSSFRCLCFRIFLRRFLITLPKGLLLRVIRMLPTFRVRDRGAGTGTMDRSPIRREREM